MNKSKVFTTKQGSRKSKQYKRRRHAFAIYVIVKPTDEKFKVKHVYNDMTVMQLKDELELATGIPASIQRLSYLDEGELQVHTHLKDNDIVPGGTVQVRVWHMYQELLEAITSNDIDWAFRIGVTSSSNYNTPGSEYMTKTARQAWLEERAFIALCLAAHRGHEELVVKLIEQGADVNRQTSTGRTPLHMASAVGNGNMVNTLLYHGADIHVEDHSGNTALSVAERFGNKVCSQNLFKFMWQERAKNVKPSKSMPLFAHQYFDSSFPVWKRGASAQIYVTKFLKPGEFEGTSLSAPKSGKHPSVLHKELRDSTFFSKFSNPSSSKLNEISSKDFLPHTSKKKNFVNLKKPDTYQEWLNKQKQSRKYVDHKNQKDMEISQELQEVEMNKEFDDSLNYEAWLELDQTEKSVHILSTSKSLSMNQDGLLPVQQDGALRLYLRSLGKSKSGLNYEDLLTQKEIEINQLIKAKNGNAPR